MPRRVLLPWIRADDPVRLGGRPRRYQRAMPCDPVCPTTIRRGHLKCTWALRGCRAPFGGMFGTFTGLAGQLFSLLGRKNRLGGSSALQRQAPGPGVRRAALGAGDLAKRRPVPGPGLGPPHCQGQGHSWNGGARSGLAAGSAGSGSSARPARRLRRLAFDNNFHELGLPGGFSDSGSTARATNGKAQSSEGCGGR